MTKMNHEAEQSEAPLKPAMENQPATAALAPSCGLNASFLAKLDAEILEDEAAAITAKDGGEWSRYQWLTGHRIGLVRSRHWFKETQSNAQSQDSAKQARPLPTIDK